MVTHKSTHGGRQISQLRTAPSDRNGGATAHASGHRTRHSIFLALAASLLALGVGPARARDWESLSIPHQRASAAGYAFDFGETDAKEPRAWLGPIVITPAHGRSCRVSDDVEIIDRPVALWRGRLLYVDTYSGSTDQMFVVDVKTCRIAWKSPIYYGPPPVLGGDRLHLAGLPPYRIGPDGLPTRDSGP